MGGVQLYLVDDHFDVVSALREAFAPYPEVPVLDGDILALASNAVVSPANSYGFMDGGIDHAYVHFFGSSIQRRVQERIGLRPEGHLPVGAGLVVETDHERIPFLIVVPTMTLPDMPVPQAAYRCMRAILRLAAADARLAAGIYAPGLGTGVGGLEAGDAARQMAEAYRDAIPIPG